MFNANGAPIQGEKSGLILLIWQAHVHTTTSTLPFFSMHPLFSRALPRDERENSDPAVGALLRCLRVLIRNLTDVK